MACNRTNNEKIAAAAENVARTSAGISAAATKLAVKEEGAALHDKVSQTVANAKENLADVAHKAVDKGNDLKDAAIEKGSTILEKVKSFSADALEKGADTAQNLADKLRQ